MVYQESMADLTFTDRMLKNTYLRSYGESSASDFRCLLCLALEKFRRCRPRGGKKLLEAVNLGRWSRDGGWSHPDFCLPTATLMLLDHLNSPIRIPVELVVFVST